MPVTYKGGDTGYAATPWENNRHVRAVHALRGTLASNAVATGTAVSNPGGTADGPQGNWS